MFSACELIFLIFRTVEKNGLYMIWTIWMICPCNYSEINGLKQLPLWDRFWCLSSKLQPAKLFALIAVLTHADD